MKCPRTVNSGHDKCGWEGDDPGEHAAETGHKLCAVEGCEKFAANDRRKCSMHNARWRRHGNLTGLRPCAPAPVRFARYVRELGPGGCWEWAGTRNNKGYGTFLVSNTPRVWMYAHRYSYEQAHGPIPKGLNVLHACDNPMCVNPAHLSLGTQADNMRDMARKGRGKSKTCKRGHEWTEENTRHFIDGNGNPNRRCRTCRRERERSK